MKRLLLIGLLSLGVAGIGSAAPSTPASAAEAGLEGLRLELTKAESTVAALHAQVEALAGEAAKIGAEIDRAKHKRDGVARDRELNALMQRSKTKTDALEGVQAELRWREPGLLALRRRVLRAIDAVLDNTRVMSDASRLELERLRATIVALVASPALPLVAPKAPNTHVDLLDGPRELREKADLLRDSSDKLRREAKRIGGRLDNAERHRRLRERSGEIDEDLFAESTSNRRVARVTSIGSTSTDSPATIASAGAHGTTTSLSPPATTTTSGTPTTGSGNVSNSNGAGAATPAGGGNTGTTGGSTGGSQTTTGNTGSTGSSTTSSPTSTTTTILRNLVDPATLEELSRTDAIDDVERQNRALKRAQTELESMAQELDRRAKALENRAAQLKQQK